MKLVDITKENWEDVIFLSTNETITHYGERQRRALRGKRHAIAV